MLTADAVSRGRISAYSATSLVASSRLLMLGRHVHAIGRVHAGHALTGEVGGLHHW